MRPYRGERLKDRPGPAESDPVGGAGTSGPVGAHRDAAPLAAAAFLLCSAGLICLSLAVPDYIRRDWSTGFAATGVPCIVVGLVLLRRRRLSGPGIAGVVLFGDLAIVLSGFASTDRNGTTAGALLSLPTLFTATFLRPRSLLVQTTVAAGCAWMINSLVAATVGVHLIRTTVLVAACACPAVIVQLLRRELDKAVLTDPLTGLANRRALELQFPAQVARARRDRLPIAVLLADIDHFKQINDQFGHLSGDEVLRVVARAVVAGVRSRDLVVRFGGEELVVVLAAPPDQVREIGERIRREVEQVTTPRPVTVSIGAAWTAPGAPERDLLDSLMRQADTRMYEAKNTGRNRAVFPAGVTG